MTAQLHILNASGSLSHLLQNIESAYQAAISRVEALIPIDGVNVLVYDHPNGVIPEYSIGGYAPRADVAEIFVDSHHPEIELKLERHLLCVLGHELHHCARWRSTGYGKTLGEAIVTEGLACAFEGELVSGFQPFYARALNDRALLDGISKAHIDWDRSDYDHASWFFGSSHMAKHTGYSIGYAIVARYIRTTGQPASRLIDVCASEVRGVQP